MFGQGESASQCDAGEMRSRDGSTMMDLIFKCRTSLYLPRNGTVTLGRRKPIASWDNVLISREHLMLRLDWESKVLDLSVTGRNAIVVERQVHADTWDVLAVVDPGASAAVPLASLEPGRGLQEGPGGAKDLGAACLRLYVLGAREESALELQLQGAGQEEGEGAVSGPAVTLAAGRLQAATGCRSTAGALPTAAAGAAAPARMTRTPSAVALEATAAATAASAAGAASSGISERVGEPAVKRARLQEAGSPASDGVAGTASCHAPAIRSATTVGSGAAAGAASASAPAAAAAVAAPSGGAAAPYDIGSPVHLMRVRGLPARHNAGCLGAQLRRLVTGPGLQLALVSNYMVDMGWLVSCCPDLTTARQFFVVHGEQPEHEVEMRHQAAAAGAPHVQLHRPPLPIAYGTHHSKAFLLTYPAGLRLIIFTANAIYADCNDKTQGLWVQDFPRKDVLRKDREPAAGTAAASGPTSRSSPGGSGSAGGHVGAGAGTSPSCAFERDLSSYFRKLAMPPAMALAVQEAITAHDFSSARGALVTSVPGYHSGPAVQLYGHVRLRQLLSQTALPSGFRFPLNPGGGGKGGAAAAAGSSAAGGTGGGTGSAVPPEGLVIQCSSMGSFDQAWLVDELGASLAACRPPPLPAPPPPPAAALLRSPPDRPHPKPSPPAPSPTLAPPQSQSLQSLQTLQSQSAVCRPSGPAGSGLLPLAVVWPTVEEVRNSIEGWFAGRSIPGPAKNVLKPFMRRFYAVWGGEVAGRQRAMPHIKTYARYRGQQLAWFLVASHNLSKAAWGGLQKNGSQLMIRSYELGVLVTPELEAVYRSSPHFGFCCTPGGGGAGAMGAGGSGAQTPLPQQPTAPSGAQPPPVTFWSLAGAEEARTRRAAGEAACVIPVPYSLPPVPYRPAGQAPGTSQGQGQGPDEPWAVDVPQQGCDALGQTWGAPMTHYGFRQPESD